MDDSARLRKEVALRAEKNRLGDEARAPRLAGPDLRAVVLRAAANAGVSAHKLRPATDAEMEAKELEIQLEHRRRQSNIMLARIPLKYRDAQLPATVSGALAAKWLDGYRAGNRSSLAILGPTGTGKTWTALALSRELLAVDTIPVTFVTAADMMAALRPSSAATTDLDLTMMGYAVTPLLVIDDLGAERMSEWTEEQLYRLADERSRNNRPMIITSNLTGKEIRARYGDRITGRLFGGASQVLLDGDDLRQLPNGF